MLSQHADGRCFPFSDCKRGLLSTLFQRIHQSRRRLMMHRGATPSVQCLEVRMLLAGAAVDVPDAVQTQLAMPTVLSPTATFVVTSTNDNGPGTLRDAIEQANATPGVNVINFNLRNNGSNRFVDVDAGIVGGDAAGDVFVIQPLTALPTLIDTTGGTWINGASQTTTRGNTNRFGPEVVLDGSLIADDPVDGLQIGIGAHANHIEGLNIQGFSGNGISIIRSNSNVILGNFIGTDATGTQSRPNGYSTRTAAGGVLLSASASGNLIGSNADGDGDFHERNVISGNNRQAVRIQQGALSDVTEGNVVQGNYLGSDAAGRVMSGGASQSYGVLFVSGGGTGGVRSNRVAANFTRGNTVQDVQFVNASSKENPVIGNGLIYSTSFVSNGVLYVAGTGGDDLLDLYRSGLGTFVRDRTTGLILQSVFTSQLLSIQVDVGNGGDTVDASGAGLGQPVSVPITMFGGAGGDTLTGGNSIDSMFGGPGNDSLKGGPGHDILNGNEDSDWLYGGEGNDQLFGELGVDYLYGENGHDSLYGGPGWDYLYGQDGMDGLYGGLGIDFTMGGPGADRFLNHSGGDFHDKSAEDAMIRFVAGQNDLDVDGVPRPAQGWQDVEIERIDTALRILHHAAGNTHLLKTFAGGDVYFARHGGFGRGSNEGVTVHLTDAQLGLQFATFQDNYLVGYTLHEMGHFWNGNQILNHNWVQFLGLSEWTVSDTSPGVNFIASSSLGDNLWYRADAPFVSEYAKSSPNEDFAESFAAYFLWRDNRPFYVAGQGVAGIPAKAQLIGRWVRSLPLYLE